MIARVAALVACGMLYTSPALAADPSVMRVAVVPSAGQMSLVIELSDEARSVSTQQVTPTQLLVEAGPIALPLKRQLLDAPSGLTLLQRVSVDEATTDAKEHVLRLGVTMKRPAPSSVRVVGRRVYIDFMVPDAPAPVAARTSAAVPVQSQLRQAHPGPNRGAAPAADARQMLTGAASRLDEIQPFLVSATSAPVPNPVVLNAVADALSGVRESLRVVQPPAREAPPFQLLVSAASMAAEAVSADFHGDRASKAKQAIAVLAAAKSQLNN